MVNCTQIQRNLPQKKANNLAKNVKVKHYAMRHWAKFDFILCQK